EFLCKKIEMMIKEKMINKKEICILTRNLSDHYCNRLINKLSEVNIEARVENTYQDLLREDIVKIILSIIKLAVAKSSPDEWVFIVNLLKKINGYSAYTKSEKINSLEKNISGYLRKLNDGLCKVRTKEELEEIINSIISYLGIQHLKSLYIQYKKGNYIDKTIENFLNLFWENYNVNKNWNNAIERFKGEYTIPIMSIHKSKGLEFNTVILLGVEGSAFWGIKEKPTEELCNFFVAASRAKENLFFTYSAKRIIKGKVKFGQKNDVKLFYDLMKRSQIVQFYNLIDDFEQGYSDYYSTTMDMVVAGNVKE
ncbi:MAG: 3'-5' exonuclease, partial [Clostridium sp.]|nr:3'-5' exonuclease [Clostridium sp.]